MLHYLLFIICWLPHHPWWWGFVSVQIVVPGSHFVFDTCHSSRTNTQPHKNSSAWYLVQHAYLISAGRKYNPRAKAGVSYPCCISHWLYFPKHLKNKEVHTVLGYEEDAKCIEQLNLGWFKSWFKNTPQFLGKSIRTCVIWLVLAWLIK